MTPQMSDSEDSRLKPIRLGDLELSSPFPTVMDELKAGPYERARLLVTLHSKPLGLIDLSPGDSHLTPQGLARQIWQELGGSICDHLREDDLPPIQELTPAGLPHESPRKCAAERERMLTKAPFASVVIATRDRPQHLAETIRSLLAQEYPKYEIIVVDNAPSSDATADLVKSAFGRQTSVRYLRQNLPGTSLARNAGTAEARGEFVALTDDDVLVDPKWLASLAAGFQISPDVGCVTGMILPLELETQAQMWIEQYGGFTKGFEERIFDLRDHRPENPLFPFNAGMFGSGANMAFKTAVLKNIGGFDPALGGGSLAQGGEDLAAFFQVIASGCQIVYEPSAIVRHSHIRDYGTLSRKMHGYGIGLSAYLTKCLYDHPEYVWEFISKIPHGLSFVLSARSSKNRRKGRDYPRELTAAERKGMLVGPFAYLRGRRQAQGLRPRFAGAGMQTSAAVSKEA